MLNLAAISCGFQKPVNKHIKSEQKQRAMFRSSTILAHNFCPLMWALTWLRLFGLNFINRSCSNTLFAVNYS